MNLTPFVRRTTLTLASTVAAVAATVAPSAAIAPSAAVNPTPPPGERIVRTAYLTGYSYYDNTPPGSAVIAYPRSDFPTRHQVAGGVGTYTDPVTLAVGWRRAGGREIPQWPVGRRFYVPFLHKYVMVEDQCGDRAQYGPCYRLDQAPRQATTWLDVWVGGGGLPRMVSEACMRRITRIHTVVFRPARDFPVNAGSVTAACVSNRFYSERVPGRP